MTTQMTQDEYRDRMRRLHPKRATPRAPHRLSGRLTRRVPVLPRAAVLCAAFAVSVPAWLPPLLLLAVPATVGDALLWPLLVTSATCLLFLLLPEIAHYGSRPGPIVLIVLGGLYLFFGAAVTFHTSVLIERGRWADVVVVSRNEPTSRGTPHCALREVGTAPGVRPLETTLGDCHLRPGDHTRVFADPLDDAGARLSRPENPSPERELTYLSAASIATGAVTGALSGHRRRRALGLLGPEAGLAEERYGRVRRGA
ncbi:MULTISPECIES: hypothetical protein [unclassified Streptomyces]|uniref:hypothetical protein n=1 Tax=unclassified Streptomyces TaxID=2593676 RepID=UPI0030787A2D